MSELRTIIEHLKQPEYVHVLLNPLPLYGMAIGAAILLGALLTKNDSVRRAALTVIAVTGLGTGIVIRYGIKGYDRVYAMSTSEAAQQWLQVHMARAEKTQVVFYVTGLLALLSFWASRKRIGKTLAVAALLGASLCVGLAGWIGHAGGQVRHSEFRDGPPSADQLPTENHHHDE